jgi:hypothetical protein
MLRIHLAKLIPPACGIVLKAVLKLKAPIVELMDCPKMVIKS